MHRPLAFLLQQPFFCRQPLNRIGFHHDFCWDGKLWGAPHIGVVWMFYDALNTIVCGRPELIFRIKHSFLLPLPVPSGETQEALQYQDARHRKPRLNRKTLFVLGAMNLIAAWLQEFVELSLSHGYFFNNAQHLLSEFRERFFVCLRIASTWICWRHMWWPSWFWFLSRFPTPSCPLSCLIPQQRRGRGQDGFDFFEPESTKPSGCSYCDLVHAKTTKFYKLWVFCTTRKTWSNFQALKIYVQSMTAATVTAEVGMLIGLYSLCEVIFSPFWGTFADKVGRKSGYPTTKVLIDEKITQTGRWVNQLRRILLSR